MPGSHLNACTLIVLEEGHQVDHRGEHQRGVRNDVVHLRGVYSLLDRVLTLHRDLLGKRSVLSVPVAVLVRESDVGLRENRWRYMLHLLGTRVMHPGKNVAAFLRYTESQLEGDARAGPFRSVHRIEDPQLRFVCHLRFSRDLKLTGYPANVLPKGSCFHVARNHRDRVGLRCLVGY